MSCTPVEEAFRDIENIEAGDLPEPHSAVTFRPVVAVTADTNAVFETSVGVIHRINDRTRFVVHAERGQPQVVDEDVRTLVTENLHATVDLDSKQFAEVFDDVEERRFGQTQTEYKGMGRRAAPAAPHDNGDLHRRQQRHVQQDLRAEPLGRLRPVDRAGVPSRGSAHHRHSGVYLSLRVLRSGPVQSDR